MAEFDRRSFLSLVSSVAVAEPGKLGRIARSNVLLNTFCDVSSQFIHPATETVHTLGYSSLGDRGHATYVSDPLATIALAALVPRFCKVGADGRQWRASTTTDGLVPVAAGGAVGSISVTLANLGNDQPTIAQGLIYQRAIGANGLHFNDGNFSVWCPWRTAVDDDIALDWSGIPIIVEQPTIFQSGPNGTTFHRRKFDGSDPAVFHGTQYLPYNKAKNGQGIYWRGGMFLIVGTPNPRLEYSKLASLTLKGTWQISGGIRQSQPPAGLSTGGVPPYYTLNPDGSGWDVTDKSISAAVGNTGDISFNGDITIGGFRGELLYQADNTHGSIYQTGTLAMHDTDGDGFCPGPSFSNGTLDGYGTVQMQSLRITNAFQALEGATGWNGKILSLEIANCVLGGGLMAGFWGPQAQPADRPPPVLTVSSLHVTSSSHFAFYRGNVFNTVDAVDTTLWIGQNDWGTSRIIIQEATITADKLTIDGIIFFAESTKGSCATYDNYIGTVTVAQSPNAQSTGNCVFNAVNWYGSLGQNNIINKLKGVSRIEPCSENQTSVVDETPVININKLNYI